MLNPAINRNHIEVISKIFNLKERQTARGFMYIFTVPITGGEDEQPLTEYMQVIIFASKRVNIKDRDMAHFTGEIKVKPAYGDYPQTLQVVGYTIEPIFGNVYKISSSKRKSEAEEAREIKDGIPF